MMKLNLLSFQLFVKEQAVKLQVDIICDGDYGTCSVKLNRLDWYTLTSECIPARLKERIQELCICSQ